jgi:phage protein U
MYAVLGDLVFTVLTSPSTFSASRRFDYAQHRVVQDRPRLQWLADDLETITVDLMLHVAFVNPKTQLDAFNTAASDHLPRALVFGNGVHRGYFVITDLVETHRQNADDGSLIWVAARLELTEYAFNSLADPAGAPIPDFVPPALVSTTTPLAGAQAVVAALPIAALLTLGALPVNSYLPPAYFSAGVSPGVSNADSSMIAPSSLNYTAVPASVAVRAAP